MILTVKKSTFTGSWCDCFYAESFFVWAFWVRLRCVFFLLLPTKIIEIYSVSLSHQRCKWISWKFFFQMVKGNHFTTLTPLQAALQSVTYHPNFLNALLLSDLASTRAGVQLVQRSGWLQTLYLHALHIWQHLHKKHSRGKSSQV